MVCLLSLFFPAGTYPLAAPIAHQLPHICLSPFSASSLGAVVGGEGWVPFGMESNCGVEVYSLKLFDLGFTKAIPKDTGRPPYCADDLLKLYVYGYMDRIRSSRRLEVETKRNIEVMGLLVKLSPDIKQRQPPNQF